MISLRPTVKLRAQRLSDVACTDSQTAFSRRRKGRHNISKLRVSSKPAPYQWAPLTDGVKENEALERKDFGKFVQFFRQASPYIEGHRGKTFVVVIPGEVCTHTVYATLAQALCFTSTCLSTVTDYAAPLCR